MRKWFPPAALALLGAAPPSGTLPVSVGGRTIAEQDGSLTFGWPGTYFESRFRGSGIRTRVESSTEHLRLLIDGVEKALLEKPGTVDLVFQGLGAGSHVIRLEKLTESQSGGARFHGFSLLPGGVPLPASPRSRRIEFIGDSYTVGYGNRSTKRECTREQVHDLTDTQQAFGPLTAKRMDADYRVNAYSGFGIVRNYNGGSAGFSLPAIYPRLKPDDASFHDAPADRWQPQVIVINLGTNDFSTPLHAGEKWTNDAELQADYRRRYVAFVRELHAAHPQAKFLLMGSDQFFGEVQQVAQALKASAGPSVATLRFGELDLMGCDWHPSLADHRRLSQSVEKAITDLRPW